MTLTIDRDGERLDSALSRLVPELTRSQAQRLIEQGAHFGACFAIDLILS